MRHGLASGGAVIDADVVAVWLQLTVDHSLAGVEQCHHRFALWLAQVEERAYVSTWDHQGVALGDGVCVSHHQCVVIAVNNAVRRQLAEGTGLVCHRAGSRGQWLEASYAALILPGGWLIP